MVRKNFITDHPQNFVVFITRQAPVGLVTETQNDHWPRGGLCQESANAHSILNSNAEQANQSASALLNTTTSTSQPGCKQN